MSLRFSQLTIFGNIARWVGFLARGLMLAFTFFASLNAHAEDFIGIIKPRQIIQVGSPVMGIVEEMLVDRGWEVREGQTLVRLVSDVERVDLDLAQARYDVAERRFIRQETLKAQSLTSEEELEKVRMEMELARFERDRRQIFLDQRVINSPVSGVIMRRLVARGEYINEQTPLLVLAQTDVLNIETILPLAQFGQIKKGMTAEIIPQDPIGGRYTAEVEVVDSVMDAASSTFGVRLKLRNDELQLPSGIKCSVRFTGS
ncbi:secretion protein HlyD [Oleiphilus messinensis]|uniref:Secretion protein HlyD n=1 Tax=Oleiphilus messinensis TaxID=141451 RepID=A0A1Y0IC50_9GAMM|nr:efflux RND transporter periplasmic adaptor subunit [Oleiphilus messinensis]ARU58041.1 secretion protein HlyD [Oleiphilus messinensis]